MAVALFRSALPGSAAGQGTAQTALWPSSTGTEEQAKACVTGLKWIIYRLLIPAPRVSSPAEEAGLALARSVLSLQ